MTITSALWLQRCHPAALMQAAGCSAFGEPVTADLIAFLRARLDEDTEEAEAKRRIVDLHPVVGGWEDEDGNDHGLGCEECGHSEEYSDRGGWCESLRLLALTYSDHPDYREDWRP